MLQQATQPLLPLDPARQRRSGGWRNVCIGLHVLGDRDIAKPLMRAGFNEVTNETIAALISCLDDNNIHTVQMAIDGLYMSHAEKINPIVPDVIRVVARCRIACAIGISWHQLWEYSEATADSMERRRSEKK